ncbi:MAG TPA: disulfide bond formation protein B [Steroidobacteraceae bacterium]|nr:disulfide bond formation protein B [Steroidobacteraceae bacterium]
MPSRLPTRLINAAGFLACAAMLGYALYSEFHLGLDPCPLCIFQRIGVLALGLAFLAAAVHNPARWGRRVYAALTALAALATAAVAARHIYIQSQPPGTFAACGAPLNVLMKMFHIWTVVAKVLHAGGECAVVNWRFAGLTMPEWVLIWMVGLGAAGVTANLRR